jgi:hypothetical protein
MKLLWGGRKKSRLFEYALVTTYIPGLLGSILTFIGSSGADNDGVNILLLSFPMFDDFLVEWFRSTRLVLSFRLVVIAGGV